MLKYKHESSQLNEMKIFSRSCLAAFFLSFFFGCKPIQIKIIMSHVKKKGKINRWNRKAQLRSFSFACCTCHNPMNNSLVIILNAPVPVPVQNTANAYDVLHTKYMDWDYQRTNNRQNVFSTLKILRIHATNLYILWPLLWRSEMRTHTHTRIRREEKWRVSFRNIV